MQFSPHPFLRNAHLMTIFAPSLYPSADGKLQRNAESYYIDVAADSKILAHLNSPVSLAKGAPCLVLVHGLEGSSSSPYMVNLSTKAIEIGIAALRVNLRNCGGTMHLSPTLYNAGMSQDILTVVDYVRLTLGFESVFLVGYSLGGNIVLKAAGELAGNAPSKLSGVCAVSPSIDLNASIQSIETGFNRMYELKFLQSLRAKIRDKAKLFPHRYDVSKLQQVNGLRSFDEVFTAPDAGYEGALHYYREASSLKVIQQLRIPTLIIAAQDDPIVPFETFNAPQLQSQYIRLLSPAHGGHGGFIQDKIEINDLLKSRDRQWAENRILEFCLDTMSKT
jgi:predicted alpha/beta-fold hydrolase